ncbi:MAG: TldD/PmbA family protein [Methanotrichaceae archaeon]|nr:TldD/PmbA family protein [Methanotrichaceae archaeon]
MAAEARKISDTSARSSASLMDEAINLMHLASSAGAEEAEVFGLSGRSIDVDLRKSSIEMASQSIHRGLGLRAVVRGAVGFSSTSDFGRLKEVAISAVRAARARGGDDEWRSLPQSGEVSTPGDVFDPVLDVMGAEEGLDLALELLDGCMAIEGAEPVSGGVAFVSGEEVIVNSLGVEVSERGTFIQAAIEAISRGSSGDGVATGYEFGNSRRKDLDLETIGREAGQMARRSVDGAKAETGTFPVLLSPVAMAEMLEHILVPALSAENVQKGRSPLSGRLGQRIAHEDLQLVDDGLLSGGMGTSGFDDEGVPSHRNVLIEDGNLLSYMYDSYAAGKDGRLSTGNAVRAGYSEVPRIGVRNLIIESRRPFDLLAETSNGILVNGLIGAHTANPISGDFSVEARNAFQVVDGSLARPIRSAMIAGNLYDLLSQMESGKDPRPVGSIITPTIRVEMKVIG